MADQAVGGVHRLVDEQAAKSPREEPGQGRHHPVIETLRQALQGGRRHALPIQGLHIPPDDPADGGPGGRQVVGLQGAGHGRHMVVEISRRQAQGAHQGQDRHPEPRPRQLAGQSPTDDARAAHDHDQGHDTGQSAHDPTPGRAVQPTVQHPQLPGHPGHRMRQTGVDPFRIAGHALDQGRGQHDPGVSGHARRSRSKGRRARR